MVTAAQPKPVKAGPYEWLVNWGAGNDKWAVELPQKELMAHLPVSCRRSVSMWWVKWMFASGAAFVGVLCIAVLLMGLRVPLMSALQYALAGLLLAPIGFLAGLPIKDRAYWLVWPYKEAPEGGDEPKIKDVFTVIDGRFVPMDNQALYMLRARTGEGYQEATEDNPDPKPFLARADLLHTESEQHTERAWLRRSQRKAADAVTIGGFVVLVLGMAMITLFGYLATQTG